MPRDDQCAFLQSPGVRKSTEARDRALAEITSAMRKTGLAASALAKEAGVAPSTVNRFLKDPENWPVPNTTTLAKIAAAAARLSAEESGDSDRRLAKAMDLADALGVKLPREKVIAFSRMMLEIGNDPERAEEIIERMIRLVRK